MKILYVLRTVIMYIYMFGYMLLYYPVLRRGEKALAAGDREALRRIVDRHIPRWCRGLLRVAGVQLIVEGRENIPAGGPAVFVGNHRSYFDIPLVLVSFDRPHGILAKEELARIPLLSRWMHLLGCVYVQRDDVRGSVQALKDAAAVVRGGDSFTIFPEGTRYKGEEGGVGEFKAGAFRIAISRPGRSASPSRPACRWCRWPSAGPGACTRATITSSTRARCGCPSCPPSTPPA